MYESCHVYEISQAILLYIAWGEGTDTVGFGHAGWYCVARAGRLRDKGKRKVMPYCPNCSAPLASASVEECPRCQATFDEGSSWQPVAKPGQQSHRRPPAASVSPNAPPSRVRPRVLAAVALVLFVASLPFPAFTCARGEGFSGLSVLMTGYMGLAYLDPRWFANITFVMLILTSLTLSPPSPKAAGITVLLALLSFAPALGCGDGVGAPALSRTIGIGGGIWMVAMLVGSVAGMSTPERYDEPAQDSPAGPDVR